jgi:hypothetical protein
MIEITQTKFVPKGNCYAACIASILELRIDRLPHLPEDDNTILEKFPIKNPEYFNVKDARTTWWHDMWGNWFKENNLTKITIKCEKLGEYDRRVLEIYHIINGPSPRDLEQKEDRDGWKHSVVGFKGLIRFDPHPSRNGLLALDSYELIVPSNINKSILDNYKLG